MNLHIFKTNSVYEPNQWETTLQCNIVSHWLSPYPYPEWSPNIPPVNSLTLGQSYAVLVEKSSKNYNDVIMSPKASQITSLSIVCPTVYSGADQRKHQSSASLALVRGIHRWPVNSPHRGPVTRKMFPFDDGVVICGLVCRYQTTTKHNKTICPVLRTYSIVVIIVRFWPTEYKCICKYIYNEDFFPFQLSAWFKWV